MTARVLNPVLFFHDKDALIAAMMQRLGEAISRDFRTRAAEVDVNRLALRDVVRTGLVLGIHRIQNDPLLTSLRYLMQEAPTIQERDFVRSMTDMLVGVLEPPPGDRAGRKRKPRSSR